MEFKEYKFKEIQKRIRMKYIRESNVNLNPWEITNFVSRISSCFYKLELLNTIAIAINQGVALNRIFIMDREYKLNTRYTGLSLIDLNTYGINKIFSIGKPIPLAPDKSINQIRFLFEYLYNLNRILYREGRRRFTEWDRAEAYAFLRQKGLVEALEEIEKIAFDKVTFHKAPKEFAGLRKEREKIEKKYLHYIEDEKKFPVLEMKLSNHEKGLKEEEEELVRKYYNIFFDYFTKLQRPIVGIFNPENQQIQILCADYFDDTINYNTHIDLKSITHNSPIMSEIEAGFSIASMHKAEKRAAELHILEKKKYELEIRNLQMDYMLKQQEAEKNALDIYARKIEIQRELNRMADRQEADGISGLDDSYSNKKLLQTFEKVRKGYSEVLRTNQFVEQDKSILDLRT